MRKQEQRKRERVRFYRSSSEVEAAVCELLSLDIRSGQARNKKKQIVANAAGADAPPVLTTKRDGETQDFCVSFDRLKIICRDDDDDDDDHDGDEVECPPATEERIVVIGVAEENDR